MDAKSFKTWLIQFQNLSERQRKQAKQVMLNANAPAGDACSLVNQRAQEVLACPHCAATHLQRWGKESGIQRYRCGACHKTFNALTGTPPGTSKASRCLAPLCPSHDQRTERTGSSQRSRHSSHHVIPLAPPDVASTDTGRRHGIAEYRRGG